MLILCLEFDAFMTKCRLSNLEAYKIVAIRKRRASATLGQVAATKTNSPATGAGPKCDPTTISRRVRAGGGGAIRAGILGAGVAAAAAMLPPPGLLLVDHLVAGQGGVAGVGATAAARATRLLNDRLDFAGFSAKG